VSSHQAELNPASLSTRYEFVRSLGEGSFGRTFLAREHATSRMVAIKVLTTRNMAEWKDAERFEREALVLRSLRHQGIPEVYDFGRDHWQGEQSTFLIMEFVEGVSLRQRIDEHYRWDPSELSTLFLELLGILEYLHTRVPPVLHRDVKPNNIIVRPDGLPALVDFGSVRRVFLGPDEAGSTVAGTYGYMPYEQYMGQALPASDLYALGATFLHVLTGRPPRDFMNDGGRIEVPSALPGDPRLGPIITRLLRPSPAERFQSAREVRQAFLESTGASVAITKKRDAAFPAVLLEPTPRNVEGDTAKLLKRVAPTTLELMDGSAKPSDSASLFDWASLAFFSVVTAGVLPMVFISMARARRRRLRRFFRDGLPALGEILSIQIEKTAFEATIARVSYQFEADGSLHRDTDGILPVIAGRWLPGDQIQVLYLPDYDYDSVIISTR
jgi:serine/threonine protein kinase